MSWNIRRNPFFPDKVERHDGIDLPYGMNEMINAAQDGVIKRISNDPNGYGNFVDILHDDGTSGRYAHAGIISRGEGQRVRRGEEIGLAGSTGRSTGPHLHFEHRDQNNRPMDPRPLLASVGGRAPTQFASAAPAAAAPTQNYGGSPVSNLPLSTSQFSNQLPDMVKQAQGLIGEPQVDPRLVDAITRNNQSRTANLPMALGAMLSRDQGISKFGNAMYEDANAARNLVPLGEDGFVDPTTGQYLDSPVGGTKRNQRMLELTMKLLSQREEAAARLAASQNQNDITNMFKGITATLGLSAERRALNNDATERSYVPVGGAQPQVSSTPAPPVGGAPVTSPAPGASPQVSNTPSAFQSIGKDPEQTHYDTRTGDPIFRSKIDGRNFLFKDNAYLPADMTYAIDSKTYNETVPKAQEVLSANVGIKKLLSEVESHKNAFSWPVRASSALPNALRQPVHSALMSEQELTTRTKIMKDAAVQMNALFGAAQSAGEATRAEDFLITDKDNIDTVAAKLKAGEVVAERLRQKYGAAVVDAAVKRGAFMPEDLQAIGYGKNQTPAGGSAIPQAAIDLLRKEDTPLRRQQFIETFGKLPEGF